jgi:urocanate hydratase
MPISNQNLCHVIDARIVLSIGAFSRSMETSHSKHPRSTSKKNQFREEQAFMDVSARITDCALVCFLARHPNTASGDEVAALKKVGLEIGCNTASIYFMSRESERERESVSG